MKKTAQRLALSLGVLAVFFIALPTSVRAFTYYQQLSDSSGTIVTSATGLLLATFTTVGTTTVTSGDDIGFAVYNFKNLNPGNSFGGGIEVGVYSVSDCTGFLASYASRDFTLAETDTDTDYFMDLTANSSNSFAAGTYYVCFKAWLHNSDTIGELRMNFSNDFFYGYLTGDNTGNSLPISPGIPGFTDFGISTTSQQIYCYQNFASTTGFLDSLGASFSQGLCNVSVFLFVPNSTVLNNFTLLGGNLQTKIPFSYFYDVSAILDGAEASSSVNFTPLTLNLRDTGVGSTSPWSSVLPASFSYLSSTTISTYVPSTLYDLLFLLMRSAIWIAVLFHVYHRLIPKHAAHV